jgi:hypothetical protein
VTGEINAHDPLAHPGCPGSPSLAVDPTIFEVGGLKSAGAAGRSTRVGPEKPVKSRGFLSNSRRNKGKRVVFQAYQIDPSVLFINLTFLFYRVKSREVGITGKIDTYAC